jgi:ABC-2 type transport system permease protein
MASEMNLFRSPSGFLLRVRAVAAKEFWALVRQPQLLLLLLVGPVLIMVAFALSFQVENALPRAVVVVQPQTEGEELFERFEERFTVRTRFQGTMESVEEADRMLEEDLTDAVIIIPPEPSESVARGEQAVLEVHYRAIHPIFGATVPNRANGLVLDLNQEIVREGVDRELSDVRTTQEQIAAFNEQLERLNEAAETLASPGAQELTGELDATLGELEGTLETLALVQPDNEEISDGLDQTRAARELLGEFREAQEGGAEEIRDRAGITELQEQLTALEARAADLPADVSANVLVNPFRLELENLAPFQPEPVGFYAPATLALLIQHISLSLASLAIVRERLSGAYEFFQVSPLGHSELLAGKFASYAVLVLAVNVAVAAVLATTLDVPVRGGFVMLSVAMALLTMTSLALGFLLSALARSQLQAIQIAMLSFIASGFFAGFLFPLEEMDQPAQSISYVLPATYGIRALREVMIMGQWPARTDLLGFAVIFVLSLALTRYLMGRKKV